MCVCVCVCIACVRVFCLFVCVRARAYVGVYCVGVLCVLDDVSV